MYSFHISATITNSDQVLLHNIRLGFGSLIYNTILILYITTYYHIMQKVHISLQYIILHEYISFSKDTTFTIDMFTLLYIILFTNIIIYLYTTLMFHFIYDKLYYLFNDFINILLYIPTKIILFHFYISLCMLDG